MTIDWDRIEREKLVVALRSANGYLTIGQSYPVIAVYRNELAVRVTLPDGFTRTLYNGEFSHVPKAPEPGDYVVWAFFPGTNQPPIDLYKPRKVLTVNPKYENGFNGGLITLKDLKTRYFANRWKVIDLKTYVEPKFKFKIGDKVIFPEKYWETIASYIHPSFINAELTVKSLEASSGYTFPEFQDRNVLSIRVSNKEYGLTPYGIPQDMFEPMPEGWVPAKPNIDLASLTGASVGLTDHGFHTCCGAKILYSFNQMGQPLRDNNGRPRKGIPVKIDEEIFTAAVKAHVNRVHRTTGVVLAVLATTQIKTYEKCLLDAGFVKINEYPNLNHGTNHMNALYAWFVQDNIGKKAKEEKRAFA